jgi:hypothetical protein
MSRSWVGVALNATAASAYLWYSGFMIGFVAVLCVVPALVFVWSAMTGLRRTGTAWSVAAVYGLGGLVGIFFGGLLFLPAAAFAGWCAWSLPRATSVRVRYVGVVALVLSLLGWSLVGYERVWKPPQALVVHVTRDYAVRDSNDISAPEGTAPNPFAKLVADVSLLGRGSEVLIVVTFRPDASDSDLVELRRLLRALPGVTGVEYCSRRQHTC